MPFDISAARQAGKTDIQIALYLGQELGFDVDAAMKAGKSPTEIAEYLSTNERPKTAVIQPVQEAPAAPESPPGLGSRVMEKAGQAWQAATNPEYSMSRKALRTAGALGEAAGDVMMTGAGSAYKAVVPQSVQQGISGAGGWLANTDIGKSIGQTFGDVGRVWGGVRGAAPETAKDVEAALQVANLVPAVAGAKAVYPAAKEGVLIAADAARIAGPKLVEAGRAVKQVVKPSLTPDEALGHVLQGKTKDLAKGKEAIKALDVKGVKTYADLKNRIDEAIPEYSRKVDAELMKDPTPRTLDQLATTQATQGGKAVTTNYVETAMNNLKELYEKTAQPVKAGEIDELIAKAKTEGLTKKEVNDLARVYGSEFTAFNPTTGAPPTTVTKQLYENVRKGLKDVSRSGLSDEAKNLDAIISSLYNTRRLIEKNVEAYNRINQKTTPRGIPERIGGAAMNALDYATLGSLKGAVAKLIPRNAGYKLQNYLDLEKNLEKNLKIITKDIERQGKGAMQPWSQTGKAITEVTRGDMNEALGVLRPAETPAAVRLVEPPTRPKGTEKAPEAKPAAATAKQPEVMVISGMPFRNADVAMQKMQQYGVNAAEYGPMEIAPGQWVIAKGGKAPGAVEKPAARQKSPPGPKSEGPENLVTLIKQKGGIKFGPTYQGDKLREFPDLKRVSNQKTGLDPDVLAEDLNAEGIASPTGNPWDGDSLIETLKSRQGRNVFTADKSDDIIYRKLKGPENEWIEQQLANLNEKVGPESISQSAGDLKASLHNEIRAEGFDIPNEEAAIREIEAFFSEVTNPIQSTVKNAGGKAAPKGGGGSLIEPELLQELSARLKGGLK